MPLIISAPKMAQAKGCARTVESLDVYPTLADICGLGVPRVLEGKSLRPLLEDPARAWEKPAWSFITRGRIGGATVRTERFRYTEWDEGRAGTELYDYEQDPTESRNLAADSAQGATIRKMKELLRAG